VNDLIVKAESEERQYEKIVKWKSRIEVQDLKRDKYWEVKNDVWL